MRGTVAKKLRKEAANMVTEDTPDRYYMYVECDMERMYNPAVANVETTIMLVDCRRVMYNLLKRIYKDRK